MPRAILVLVLIFLLPDLPAAPAPALEAEEQPARHRMGRSFGGLPIFTTLLGLPGEVEIELRPRLLIVAGLQADHRIGPAVADRLTRALLEETGEDPELETLLRHFAVEVLPLANPDAAALLAQGPVREFRTNLRPVDEDRDGYSGEDPPRDLDGDGQITWMRQIHPEGTLVPSPGDPRELRPADPAKGERGIYRLLPEGIDADGDGRIAEDGEGGVDLDRNFPHGYEEHHPASGSSSPSEPESRALAEHVLGTPQIAVVLVYGRRDNLSKVPAENKARGRTAPTGPLSADLPWFSEISRRYGEITGKKGGAADPASGAFHQWVYYQRGIPAFSTSLPSSLPSRKDSRTDRGAPWRPFMHPDLGPLEIGGRLPPEVLPPTADHIEEALGQQVRLVRELLSLLPRPRFRATRARPLGGGAFEVTATLANEGFLPVVTAMGERNGAVLPIRIEIDVEPDRLMQGERRTLLPRLAGKGEFRSFRWVMLGQSGERISIVAATQNAGAARTEVTLP